MRKILNVVFIILFLVAICVTEQILANKYLGEMKTKMDALNKYFISIENIADTKLINDTNQVTEFWTKKEEILCNFVNHKDIEDIGVELNKMQSAIKNNDKNAYSESLKLIFFYLNAYRHVIGISIQNIF
ncbi:MAG: DUF4363 family protein [Clostridia bacterium]|nr:DUF4363 family protein [Clostridia bacterium]